MAVWFCMHFLYPSDPFRKRRPDEFYAAEFAAAEAAGLGASVFSLEDFQAGRFAAFPPLPATTVIYRGWMLSSVEYQSLVAAIRQSGAEVLTDTATYLATHHLPNWYPLIQELTSETRVFAATVDLPSELRALDWPAYFIKDYVKSLKTATGSLITTPDQATAVAAEMLHFRATIEGGFCVRRGEEFKPGSELRYFVLDSVPQAATGPIPSSVSECARRIRSRFFSVDVAIRSDGMLRVVEVGDGQVSDLVGWSSEQFVSLFTTDWQLARV
jgi:hypothetical protein